MHWVLTTFVRLVASIVQWIVGYHSIPPRRPALDPTLWRRPRISPEALWLSLAPSTLQRLPHSPAFGAISGYHARDHPAHSVTGAITA